jgi:hypothetical protein
MAKAKKIVRRAWTKDDVRTMKTMAKAKSGVAKIAKALKRTPGATSVMAAKLGVSLSTRGWKQKRQTGYGLSQSFSVPAEPLSSGCRIARLPSACI